MIISEIYIDGFGLFNGHKIDNLRMGVNIIIGENETGKSTLLNFIRYTLFGYPLRNADKCEPLYGGKHGGRIVALLKHGQNVVFERFAGSKGGKIKLHYDGRDSESILEWDDFLGNSNSNMYKNVYGISLSELVEFNKIEEAGIADKILSIGIGMGNVSVSNVIKIFTDRINEIYKKGGSVQVIPGILKSIESLKDEVSRIQLNLPRYEEVVGHMVVINDKIEKLDVGIKQNSRQRTTLENYLKCYENYISLLQMDRELEHLPKSFECPPDSETIFLKFVNQREQLNSIIENLDYNDDKDGIQQLGEQIRSISYNEKIVNEDNRIKDLKSELSKYENVIKENKEGIAEIETLEKNIKTKLKNISNDWENKNIEEFSNVIEYRSRTKQFQDEYKTFKESIIGFQAKQQALVENASWLRYTNIHYLLAVFLVIVAIPTYFYFSYYTFALLGLAVIIITVKWIFFKKKPDIIGEQLGKREKELQEHKGCYKKFLSDDLHLSEETPYDALPQIFDQIETLKTELAKLINLNKKKTFERDPYINEFESRVAVLKRENIINDTYGSNKEFINALETELISSKKRADEKSNLERVLKGKENDLENANRQLGQLQEGIKKLLKSSNCNDEDEFKRKVTDEKTAKDLLEKKKNLINTIELIVGFEKKEGLFEYLRNNAKQDIEKKIEELTEQIMGDDRDLSDLRTKFGELKNEKETLNARSTLAETATEMETEREKLFDSYKSWLVNKISLIIFEKIKETYEKEKQPDVIKNAGEFFSKITSAKYGRINVSMEDRNIAVIDASEKSKQIDQLSRGTKEQLLICLRLGLIEEYEKIKEPLPLVLDDIFVNFDPERTKSIATIVESFAENRQVLIFTCHPELASNFSDSINKISL